MRLIYLLVLINILPLSTTIAQVDTVEWCPSGATWLYERTSFFSQEYIKLSYVSDTTINNIPTKILATYQVQIVGPGPYPQYGRTETYIKDEFYANVNDSVYWWNNGQFNFLYDFSPSLGDTWIIHENKDFTCNSTASIATTDTMEVINLDSLTISGRIFDYTYLKTQKQWRIAHIIKNIGSIYTPFPLPINPDPTTSYPCQHNSRYGNPSYLVCYYDDIRGFLNSSNNPDGNYFLTPNNKIKTPAKQFLSAIKIYPNPTNDWVHISTNNNTILQYSISDIQGRLLFQKKFSNTSINLETLPPGIYILNLQSSKEQYSFKIVKL